MIDLEFTPVGPYCHLMVALLERRIAPAEFESVYLALYKWHPRGEFPSEVAAWLGRVFSAVNDYSPDAADDPDLIDEDELRHRVEAALRGLEAVGVVRRLPAGRRGCRPDVDEVPPTS
ncbi:colicin immunity domain-containing protein [Saccharothrix sp. HUAS TT1]|uniref:colicin immunity domain-containing protein n=1 Tax=unclassified Saccharothrix TaxID=2593673 RepID=UPI00345BD706